MMMPWISWMETPEARANSGKKTPSICFFITCCIINLILKNKKMHVEIEHIEIYMDNVTQNIIFFSISRINKANMILLL